MQWLDNVSPDEYRRHLVSLGIEGADELSLEELSTLHGILEETMDVGMSSTHSALLEEDFSRPPPTIQEFISDDYYLGKVCKKTEESSGLYPKWIEVLYELFSPQKCYKQLILTGSIGLGKSWLASVVMLYKMARCLCMRNPLAFFGLKATTITFSYFSITQAQVKGGTFADTVLMMAESPFFMEHLKDNAPNRKYADRRIEFVKNLKIEAGSKVHEAIGRNTLCSLIDEINFRLEKDAAKAASDLFAAIDRRYKSRFRHTSEGLIILISSARNENDFINTHISKYRHDPSTLICDFPWWDVVGAVRIAYSGKKFYVDIGDALNPPAVLMEQEATLGIPSHRVIEVPIEHLEEFNLDTEGSIRDVAGISTGRISKLFPGVMPLINTIADGCVNPFRGEQLKLSLGSPHKIIDFLANEGKYFIMTKQNRPVPIRHPAMPRYLHMDVSTGAMDAFGLAMVHPVAHTNVERTNVVSQLRESMLQPIFEVDFALRITRERPDDPIDFTKIRSFIFWLRKCNFKIRRISYDLLLLSHEMGAVLKKAKFDTMYLSMDKTKAGYETFKNMVLEERLRMFQHNYFIIEAANLENGYDKIDHPTHFNIDWKPAGSLNKGKGSKDVADAIGGAVYNGILDINDPTVLPYVETAPTRILEAAKVQSSLATKYDAKLRHHIGDLPPEDIIYTIE